MSIPFCSCLKNLKNLQDAIEIALAPRSSMLFLYLFILFVYAAKKYVF